MKSPQVQSGEPILRELRAEARDKDVVKPELSEHAPSQIGSVVGVDKMDSLDRQKLDPTIKLQLIAAEFKSAYGHDPRGGGASIVARPRIVLQLLLDLKVGPFSSEVKLERPLVFGTQGADVVAHWQGVPIIVRCQVADDNIYCLPNARIPQSAGIDRVQAGQLRMAAHNGKLEGLRD